MATEQKDPEYIGDGVYVWHDGYQLWFTTGAHYNPPLLAMEPEVLQNLDMYRERVGIGVPK